MLLFRVGGFPGSSRLHLVGFHTARRPGLRRRRSWQRQQMGTSEAAHVAMRPCWAQEDKPRTQRPRHRFGNRTKHLLIPQHLVWMPKHLSRHQGQGSSKGLCLPVNLYDHVGYEARGNETWGLPKVTTHAENHSWSILVGPDTWKCLACKIPFSFFNVPIKKGRNPIFHNDAEYAGNIRRFCPSYISSACDLFSRKIISSFSEDYQSKTAFHVRCRL